MPGPGRALCLRHGTREAASAKAFCTFGGFGHGTCTFSERHTSCGKRPCTRCCGRPGRKFVNFSTMLARSPRLVTIRVRFLQIRRDQQQARGGVPAGGWEKCVFSSNAAFAAPPLAVVFNGEVASLPDHLAFEHVRPAHDPRHRRGRPPSYGHIPVGCALSGPESPHTYEPNAPPHLANFPVYP